jgi:glucose-1-phosphate thymidylyltransferase
MIDHGAKLKVIDVEGWYDAGEVGTLLDTNRTILEKGRARRPAQATAGVTFVDPVYIGDNVTIAGSTVGPNVTLEDGATVNGSELRNTIVGPKATITGSRLTNSLVGEAAVVDGVRGEVNVGDHSTVRIAT